MEKVMEKVKNKITKEELDVVQEQHNKLNLYLNRIGLMSAQHHALLHEISVVNKAIEENKAELEKKYGEVNINVETGEFTKIESDEDNKKD
tara:strand:- start:1575 stop:1847 length:273 start_codon:yes stop_codon:yes gene_type:complete